MKTLKILGTVTALMVSSLLVAGQYSPQPVTIDLDERTASGDMITARFSPNEHEYIGCGVRVYDNGVGGTEWYGFCQAVNEKKEKAFCNSSNKELLQAITATADFSYIAFDWDKEGNCTRIGYSTQSFYIPKILGE
ncbi:MAG: hypothetical protein AB8F65_14210 [Woeseiaceae bacterium]